jgi:nucleoside-diphosphate-sugar epimerase
MKTIAVIGANGQVGTEVSLYLNQWEGVRVVAICRTETAAAFLKLCGVECRYGSVGDSSQYDLLAGCDVVADFSLPRGQPSEVRETTRSNLNRVFAYAPANAALVYISTTAAYGTGPQAPDYRAYLLATTAYGIIKRVGERLADRLGRKTRRPTFSLRLGQVNGDLQGATQALIQGLKPGTVHVPDGQSDAVFAFSIAEALVKIAGGLERPGLYTLVSSPEWSWEELYRYYSDASGIPVEIVKVPYPPYGRLGSLRTRARDITGAIADGFSAAYRGTFQGYVLSRYPALERMMTMRHRHRAARREIAGLRAARQQWPFRPPRGAVPGRRLQSLSDSRITMSAARSRVLATVEESVRRVTDSATATLVVGHRE